MKVLHFGAGNIGLGFIGKIFSQSHFDVIFADINQDIIDTINTKKYYFVRVVSKFSDTMSKITGISAIHCNNPNIIKEVTAADLITTAAGPSALDKIASLIADGIMLKYKTQSINPLNIIACENKMKASSFLKYAVLNKLPIKYHTYTNHYIGFVDCSIDTIVPSLINQYHNSFVLIAEDFQEWIVNLTQFKGNIPTIINMKLSSNLDSFIERKLFTLNTGHAIAAYLGWIKKHHTIHQAISDKKINFIVKSAMQESGNVLIKHYNFNKQDHTSYINKIFDRFENPVLLDNIVRIARNPLQKLQKDERLIKPLLGCIKYGLSYAYLAKGVASALLYDNKNDLESLRLSSLIYNQGIKKTLSDLCGLSINSEEARLILSEYHSICHLY